MNDVELPVSPSAVDPEQLKGVLERSGWGLAGGRRGRYARIAPPSSHSASISGWTLFLPLDKLDPDFEELMGAALADLRRHSTSDFWSAAIFPNLQGDITDTFRFTKESAAPPGLIPWKQGEELINSSRATLLAGAKSYRQKSRRFSNRQGRFASRYLDSVMMGQTAVGSYVVTAYTPVEAEIPLSAASAEPTGSRQIGTVNSRGITVAISSALEATLEALAHYRKTGTFSAFDAGVQQGVSYDLTWALRGITSESDGAEIKIEWNRSHPVGNTSGASVFEFRGSDSAALETASYRLASNDDISRPITVIGRVHLLSKKAAGAPGVFGIETIHGRRHYRVRLADPEQYHLALQAHDGDSLVKVIGDLEADGTLQWIYSADIDPIVEGAEIAAALSSEKSQSVPRGLPIDSGQLSIDDAIDG